MIFSNKITLGLNIQKRNEIKLLEDQYGIDFQRKGFGDSHYASVETWQYLKAITVTKELFNDDRVTYVTNEIFSLTVKH